MQDLLDDATRQRDEDLTWENDATGGEVQSEERGYQINEHEIGQPGLLGDNDDEECSPSHLLAYIPALISIPCWKTRSRSPARNEGPDAGKETG